MSIPFIPCTEQRLLEIYGTDPKTPPPAVDARVLTAARAIQRGGWRVTSVYRPDGGHHSQGIALDVAPMLYSPNRFGPRTAKYFLQWLQERRIEGPWLVVSERDHIHIQLHDRDLFGYQPKRGELYLVTL